MRRGRRQYRADWKAKVASEAVKGQRTIQQIASHYEVHPRMVMQWKKRLLEGAAGMDRSGGRRSERGAAMRAGGCIVVRALLPGVGSERRDAGVDAAAGRAVHADAILRGASHDALVAAARLRREREAREAVDAAVTPVAR